MKKMMVMGAALFAALSAFAGVKETDWAKIETPDSWTPDTPLEVKITLKGNAPAGAPPRHTHGQRSPHPLFFKPFPPRGKTGLY